MPLAPPPEDLLDQSPMELMQLFGRLRGFADHARFRGTLPAIWQCSDESQSIKKALFGYVFNCPSFNLGRVGALLDPNRLATAAYHGHDLVIVGGSHVGAEERAGIGYIRRIHEQLAPCCGMLRRMLDPYLQVYLRGAQLIRIFRDDDQPRIEIPYKYLFRKPAGETPRLQLHRQMLIAGEAVGEGALGKIYTLQPALAALDPQRIAALTARPEPIGSLLQPSCFTFSKKLDRDSHEPLKMLEVSVFEFLSEVVTARRPHRRLCNVNTWRQFHRIASYLTDAFDGSDRNIFVLAGLTIDHSIRHNSFIPQFGFWMERGRAMEARYYGPAEVYDLLAQQPVHRPAVTFLEYAGIA
ncbi:MAG: hypothetical protein RQ723_08455 [Desulfuromonadales bacterium]|nr:hypothetical protein [Desulfuromonadales bacterium]